MNVHSPSSLAHGPSGAGHVAARYSALVASGAIERDPAQVAVVRRLDALVEALEAYRPAPKSGLSWLFGKKAKPVTPRGLYIWGSVGRGKTMLMDLFYGSVRRRDKRRIHFHAFMADAHERIHDWRQKAKRGEVEGDDPIRPGAAALAAEAQLLCFDEFAVTDIANAMILGRLFTAMFERGVVVVATSNVEPQDLYREGLNRTLFLPFIGLLTERMEVLRLDARTDFRLEKIGDSPVYFVPADGAARAAMDDLFARMTRGGKPVPGSLEILGRSVPVPAHALGVARFSYEDLCRQPLGAADFIAIARAFHTIFIDGIPVIEATQRNEAKRFITLIDVLYERHVKLIASAEAEPQKLFRAESGTEAFEFDRTASRLTEMRSEDWLNRWQEAKAAAAS